MEVVACLDEVTKRYGRVTALDAVSVTVASGVTTILGPNGAGKSTMVELLCGLRRPDSGRVQVLGGDPSSLAVRSRMGLTPQSTALPWRLTVAETLHLLAAHYRRPLSHDRVVDLLDLGEFQHKRNGVLSGGQRRRVALAAALVGDPQVLFLDEPTSGLDTDSKERLWSAIAEVAEAGRTVLLTTHDMAEAEHLARRVVVVSDGRVCRAGTVDTVIAEVGLHLVEVELPADASPSTLATVPADRVGQVGGRTRLYSKDPDATVRALVHQQVPFRQIRVERVGLADAIKAITATTSDEPRREETDPSEMSPDWEKVA